MSKKKGVSTMPERVFDKAFVAAPLERCFAIAADVRDYPSWAREVRRVDLVEQDPTGLVRVARFVAGAMGFSVTLELHYDMADAPDMFSWRGIPTGRIRRYEGSYRFESTSRDGISGTEITYELLVDFKVPLPQIVQRRAESMMVRRALQSVRQVAESTTGAGG